MFRLNKYVKVPVSQIYAAFTTAPGNLYRFEYYKESKVRELRFPKFDVSLADGTGVTLYPAFSPDIFDYAVTVPANVAEYININTGHYIETGILTVCDVESTEYGYPVHAGENRFKPQLRSL